MLCFKGETLRSCSLIIVDLLSAWLRQMMNKLSTAIFEGSLQMT